MFVRTVHKNVIYIVYSHIYSTRALVYIQYLKPRADFTNKYTQKI